MNNSKIYQNPENTTQTFVCFGTGHVVIARNTDDIGQQMVWLGDTGESHRVGAESGPLDWENEVTGNSVILGFNKVESIDILVEALLDAKYEMLRLVRNKNENP